MCLSVCVCVCVCVYKCASVYTQVDLGGGGAQNRKCVGTQLRFGVRGCFIASRHLSI